MNFKDYLSNLPFLKGKEEHYENYFGLYISYTHVTATVWSIHKNNLVILNTASAPFENGDDFKSEKTLASLAGAANYCLDEALADIMPEPTQLLFGVPETWLHDENIRPEYLKILKKLVKELDVTPMAYVSTAHAIAHLLQKQQGIPLTATLIEVADSLVINVIKAGKTQASLAAERGSHIGKDIEKALLTVDNIEVLPSKILIYGSGDLEKIKDELASFPWMNQLPFLHLPRIEVLSQSIASQAICFAGGSELAPGIVPKITDYTESRAPQSPRLSHKVDLEEENERSPMRHNRIPEEAAAAGFAAEELEPQDGEYEDVFEEQETEGVAPEGEWEEEEEEREALIHQRGRMPAPRVAAPVAADGILDRVLAPIRGLVKAGPATGKNTVFGIITNKFILLGLLIVIVFLGLMFFFTKAKVTMFVDMKTIENTAEVVADPSATSVDPNSKTIPGKILETDETGSDTASATGTKQVGDPAKGAIVIYNKTDNPHTFSQGTVLVGPNNLQFTLDTSVTVASQSAVEGGIAFGKESANVTASAIGPDSNLPAGKDLTIKGQSSDQYAAKVDQALSGGVSKNVTVVTADDQKKLLAKVSSDLRTKAQQDLQGKLTGDQKILTESFVEKISKSSYSKNVGDQASTFSLTLTAHYKGTAYSDSDLKTVLAQIAQVNNPDKDKYTLDMSKTQTQTDVSKVDTATGKLYFTAKMQAQLMPKYDTELIKKQIAGKSPSTAEALMKTLDNVIDVEVQLSPALPGPLQRLPFMAKNISIDVTTK